MPLQDGAEGPAGLHRCLELTQRVVGQQRHRDVVKQPLTQRLAERRTVENLNNSQEKIMSVQQGTTRIKT